MKRKQRSRVGPRNLEVELRVSGDRYATVTNAYLTYTSRTGDVHIASASGVAKKMTGDVYDDQIAIDLSASRALARLSKMLYRRGASAVERATQLRIAEQALAGIYGRPRTQEPLPLETILDRYGLAAAKRAAARRGMMSVLVMLVQKRAPEKPAKKAASKKAES